MRPQFLLLCLIICCLGTLARAAAPAITSFSPTSGPIGTVVTVTGTNLATAPTAKVNGKSATVQVTTIKLTIAAGTTTGKITVTTPGGTATSATNFTVIPAPTVTSFSPTSGPIGRVVTISGTNFTGATTVKFNGTAAATYSVVNSTSITATVPGGAKSGKITVTTPGGTATSAGNFTVIPAPVISSFTPASGGVGTIVTLTGTNFTGTSAVKINATTASSFIVLSASSIKVTVPTGTTSGKISVTTPGGTAISATNFTFIPAPGLSSFTPASGGVGTIVTLSGSNFSGASALKINATTASVFTVVSSSSIKVTVPSGATSGKISVTTPGGTVASAANFTVVPAPIVSSFTPTSGPIGTVITITGRNFTGASAVKINATAASSFTVLSATSIKVTVPAYSTAGKISVTTPGGTATSAAKFTITGGAPGTPGINPTDHAALVWVPGGSFTMGTPYGAFLNEPYTQQVTLSGYWMYKYEVTVEQYRAFCAATSRALPPFPRGHSWTGKSGWSDTTIQQYPIVYVKWYDAKAYADWAGVYLPTEAEWEYAARGVQGRNYPWGGTATANDEFNGWDETKCANTHNSSEVGKSTWPVGSFPAGASWCGAQDMAGNVWEWCADWYGSYSSMPVSNPTGPTSGDYRVLRGGSWYYDEDLCRSADRGYNTLFGFYDGGGFRCVSLSPGP